MPKSKKLSAAAMQRKKSDMSMKKTMRRWAFTVSCDKMTKDELAGHLSTCKRWVFQKEKGGDTGHEHFQGRFSLKDPQRATSIKWIHGKGHLSVESLKGGTASQFYCMKEDTRMDGPWKNTTQVRPVWSMPSRAPVAPFIPKEFKDGFELKAWQAKLRDLLIADTKDPWSRTIRYICDPKGNSGKTVFSTYMEIYHNAIELPAWYITPKKIMEAMYANMVGNNDARIVIIDFTPIGPVADARWHRLATFLEYIKEGYAYSKRHQWKEVIFEPPALVVMCTSPPPKGVLSGDHWERFQIVDST